MADDLEQELIDVLDDLEDEGDDRDLDNEPVDIVDDTNVITPSALLDKDSRIMPPPPLPLPLSIPPLSSTFDAFTPATTTATTAATPTPILGALSERTTRSSYATRGGTSSKPKKLKLKLSDKAAAQTATTSFLGTYDRELDSDVDEEGAELLFEEHFILRMPHGEDLERLRKMVANRDIGSDVWFKFKDSRRALFHVGNSTYSAKLVDLPCIVESQKTFDNKHMFKVADISQMLVVEDKINPNADPSTQSKSFNAEDFIWPHGVTPPLRWARKRRFRKRLNKRTIETVEQEVERLLSEDALASAVQYEVLENVNPDLSDSEFLDPQDLPPGSTDIGTPFHVGSDMGDAPTPATHTGDDDGDEDDDDEEEEDGDIDEELAAELDLALGSQGSSDEDSDQEEDRDRSEEEEEEEEEEDDDDDDGYDNAEAKRSKKLLNEEIRDLEAVVSKKSAEIEKSQNLLIKRRFEEQLRKLRNDLELKLAQRTQLDEARRRRKEKKAAAAAKTDEDGGGEDGKEKKDVVDGDVDMDVEGVDEDGDAGIEKEDELMDDLFGAPAPEQRVDPGGGAVRESGPTQIELT